MGGREVFWWQGRQCFLPLGIGARGWAPVDKPGEIPLLWSAGVTD